MAFWTYMLHCRGGFFYVGQTDDLERRIGEHRSGLIPGFTAEHLLVELVWSDKFASRDEAKAAERRIKGWSRAKKMALIRDDWERISMLAKRKNGPSASSGQSGIGPSVIPGPDRPELAEGLSFSLQPHPQARPSTDRAVCARMSIADGLAWLKFEVTQAGSVLIPKPGAHQRLDGLWQTTCFELFVHKQEGYTEFNFSPSGDWAAYRFREYRESMTNQAMKAKPSIETNMIGGCLTVVVFLDRTALPDHCTFGLSAVIEETDGTKSYWALAHPPGKPDFHHPACFAATLEPPSKT